MSKVVLDRRIPTNPKYKNVKATVDTGASLSKYMRKIEDIRQNYRYKPDEIFKRMKVTTFTQLVVQVFRISELSKDVPPTPDGRPDSADDEVQQIQQGGRGEYGYSGSPAPSLAVTEGDYGPGDTPCPETGRSTLLSVAGGVGELDLNQPPPAPSNRFVDDSCPYLLLDVRESDEYQRCHIITALSYPKSILSRSVNYESKEMLGYKNKPGKIIVVYDEDERLAHPLATTLVQRGYDNLFLLSGGLKVAVARIPEGLITGTLPESMMGKPCKGKAVTMAVTMATQKHFTEDDIDRVEIFLDSAMQDNSVGSRLSKASTSSSRTYTKSSMSARSTASDVTGRPAFRPP